MEILQILFEIVFQAIARFNKAVSLRNQVYQSSFKLKTSKENKNETYRNRENMKVRFDMKASLTLYLLIKDKITLAFLVQSNLKTLDINFKLFMLF